MAGSGSPVLPRLLADAYLVSTGDGARVVTNAGAETFTGALIHQWLHVLAPYLDGTRTMDDLLAPLPDDKREMVRRIVATLAERGLVRDGPGGPGGELGYLDAFVADADRALPSYHGAHVLLAGAGAVRDELARLLRRCGVRRISVAADVPDTLAGVDLVVHLPDRAEPDVLLVGRACREQGVPVLHCVRLAGELWIGAELESGWRRLNADGLTVAGGSRAVADPLNADAVAVAAGMLGMAVFRRLTGVDEPAGENTAMCLRLDTLRTTTHRYLPHRLGATASGRSVTDSVARLRAGAALDPDALDKAGTRLVDPRLGVLREVSERDYTQLPLNVAAVRVAGWTVPVTGAGLTVREARWRAVLAGVGAYSASTVDPGRLVGGRIPAVRLAGGPIRLIDSDAVFTAADGPLTGVAARYTWSVAVADALLEECTRLSIDLLPGAEPVLLDPAGFEPDDEALAYLRMLEICGVVLSIVDITGPLRMPTLALCSAGRTLACAGALSAGDALRAGLRVMVLGEQARRSGESAYAPPTVPLATPVLRPATATGDPPAPTTVPRLLAALAAHGFDPVVIPLDHDPEVHRIMPYVARVVIADG